jgi:hypothetical protein
MQPTRRGRIAAMIQLKADAKTRRANSTPRPPAPRTGGRGQDTLDWPPPTACFGPNEPCQTAMRQRRRGSARVARPYGLGGRPGTSPCGRPRRRRTLWPHVEKLGPLGEGPLLACGRCWDSGQLQKKVASQLHGRHRRRGTTPISNTIATKDGTAPMSTDFCGPTSSDGSALLYEGDQREG